MTEMNKDEIQNLPVLDKPKYETATLGRGENSNIGVRIGLLFSFSLATIFLIIPIFVFYLPLSFAIPLTIIASLLVFLTITNSLATHLSHGEYGADPALFKVYSIGLYSNKYVQPYIGGVPLISKRIIDEEDNNTCTICNSDFTDGYCIVETQDFVLFGLPTYNFKKSIDYVCPECLGKEPPSEEFEDYKF